MSQPLKVLVYVDARTVEVASLARRLLGDAPEYKVVAIAPDRRTPFLDDDTVRGAQAEIDRTYGEVARKAADSIGASAEVRAGSVSAELVAAAREEGADVIAIAAPARHFWSPVLGRHLAERLLADGTCAVLLLKAPDAAS